MPTHTERIDRIKAKAAALAKQYRTLEADHAKLRSEVEKKDAMEAQWRDRTQQLEKQLQLSKHKHPLVVVYH